MEMYFGKETVNRTIPVTISLSDGINTTIGILKIRVVDHFPPQLDQPLPDMEFDEDTAILNAFNISHHFTYDDPAKFIVLGNENVLVKIKF